MTDYMGCAARGGPATRQRLTVHGTARHVPQDIKGDILKMLRDLLGYVLSHDSCNMLLLTGYLLDLTNL